MYGHEKLGQTDGGGPFTKHVNDQGRPSFKSKYNILFILFLELLKDNLEDFLFVPLMSYKIRRNYCDVM
jgi:hypothetical protein